MRKEEREICEFEIEFKKSFCCCCSNLSNDDIITEIPGLKTEIGFYRPGLKTGVKNDIIWSEIRARFREPGGESPPRIPRSTPLGQLLSPPRAAEASLCHREAWEKKKTRLLFFDYYYCISSNNSRPSINRPFSFDGNIWNNRLPRIIAQRPPPPHPSHHFLFLLSPPCPVEVDSD